MGAYSTGPRQNFPFFCLLHQPGDLRPASKERDTCVCPCIYEKHGELISILTLSKIQETGQLARFFGVGWGTDPVIELMFFFKFFFIFMLCV